MKNTNLISLVLLIEIIFFFLPVSSLFAQNTAPVFEQQPSTVLDLWENGGQGKYKDNVKFINATLRQNITVSVYGYEQKNGKWTLIGAALLKYYGDTDTVASLWKGKMNEFRYLAVLSSDGKKFDAQSVAYRNDISITIFEILTTGIEMNKTLSNDNAPSFNLQFSIVLDLWENAGQGKYKDYVKLTNGSLKYQNISFNVYGYNQKNNQWMIIGPSRLNTLNDTDTVDSSWRGRINEFRWLAVLSMDEIEFNAQAIANRNDLSIMIID